MNDEYFMRKALALAERGRGQTSPNPMVGAIVVDRDGVIVGRGAHRAAGGPHAEVFALEEARARASGSTLYCTLEPCAHTGRTGPCAPLVAAAGIRRAVIALEDPHPLVQGRGLAYLRERGVAVETGLLAREAARQNEVFLTNVRCGRPFVIVKAALSLDGCIAEPDRPVRLTGAASDRVIQRQRAEVDAIGVGSSTVLSDDPRLTARGAYRQRPLMRVVFDRRLRTPPDARLFSTLSDGPIMIMSTRSSVDARRPAVDALERAGARVVAMDSAGLQSSFAWLLRDSGIGSLVVEGGAALHRALFDAGLVDAVHAYITPARLGERGLSWMPPGRITLSELRDRRSDWFGDDVRVEGYVYRHR